MIRILDYILRFASRSGGAFFQKDNDVDRFHVAIGEIFSLILMNEVVLAHEEVGTVAGASFAGEIIADALHFHIDETAVRQSDKNVHDDERAFFGDAGVLPRKPLCHGDFLSENAGEQAVEALGMKVGIEDCLKEGVEGNL